MEQLDEIPQERGRGKQRGLEKLRALREAPARLWHLWCSQNLLASFLRGFLNYHYFLLSLNKREAFSMQFLSAFHCIQHGRLCVEYSSTEAQPGITARTGATSSVSFSNTASHPLPQHPGKTGPGSLKIFYSGLFSYSRPGFSPFWLILGAFLICSVQCFCDRTQFPPSAHDHMLNPSDFLPPPPKKQKLGAPPLPKMSAATQSKRPIPTLQDLPFLAGQHVLDVGKGRRDILGSHLNIPLDIDLFIFPSFQLLDPS